VTEALLPCPFCGGAADLLGPSTDLGGYWIRCTGAPCPIRTAECVERDFAVAAWNRRAPGPERAAIVAWLRGRFAVHFSNMGGMTTQLAAFVTGIERGEHLPATSAVKEPGT
jgi:Restriction alleviation protein Lar